MPLPLSYSGHPLDAGVDEAGRGCLAGPVVAAAVILPADFTHPFLTDSKLLSRKKREALREEIQTIALAWKVGIISPQRIDEVNVLNATYEAMHQAIAGLSVRPALLSIDGNRFRPYPELPHHCLVKGDSRFLNIAAASILAKTYRDDLMRELHPGFPHYGWDQNKGYPTQSHRRALGEYGPSPHHRQSFRWKALPSLPDQ